MQSILIAAKTKQVCDNLSELLTESEYNIVSYTSGAEINQLDVALFDVIIISTPLEDEFGLNLTAQVKDRTSAGLIVLTKSDIADEVQSKLKFTGAFVIGRPFPKSALIQAIKFAEVSKAKMNVLAQENAKLSQQIIDMKTINRAKSMLMECLKLTEEQAHKHIQKQSMDLRKPQVEIAEDILKTYLGNINK